MALTHEQKEKLTEVFTAAIDRNPQADIEWEGAFITYENGTQEPATLRKSIAIFLANGSTFRLVEKWLDEHPEETFENVCEALEVSNGSRLKL